MDILCVCYTVTLTVLHIEFVFTKRRASRQRLKHLCDSRLHSARTVPKCRTRKFKTVRTKSTTQLGSRAECGERKSPFMICSPVATGSATSWTIPVPRWPQLRDAERLLLPKVPVLSPSQPCSGSGTLGLRAPCPKLRGSIKALTSLKPEL